MATLLPAIPCDPHGRRGDTTLVCNAYNNLRTVGNTLNNVSNAKWFVRQEEIVSTSWGS